MFPGISRDYPEIGFSLTNVGSLVAGCPLSGAGDGALAAFDGRSAVGECAISPGPAGRNRLVGDPCFAALRLGRPRRVSYKRSGYRRRFSRCAADG